MSGAPAGSERRGHMLEVRLHARSPFGPMVNGVLVWALSYAIYLIIAAQVGQPILETSTDGELQVNSGSWAALVLSLIFAVSVTIPPLAQRQWDSVCERLAATLDAQGAAQAHAMSQGAPRSRGRGAAIAFGIGAVGGVAFNAWLMAGSGLSLTAYLQSTGGWFTVMAPLLFGLGARSARELRIDDQDMAALVTGHLQVTPARFDQLDVYGRLALRSALAWLIMAAIILLFFVYAAPVAISVGTLVFSLLAAAYAFTSTIAPVVRAATAIREDALAGVRGEIEAEAARVVEHDRADTPAQGRLADLIAYEAWLEKRPVWPISAPVTRRLALYGFIPVMAWFGAAAAELALERMA